MTTLRFGLYSGTLGLNAGTPSENGDQNGNPASTSADIDTIIDSVIQQLEGASGKYEFTDIFLWLFHFPDTNSPFYTSNPDTLTWNGVPITPLTTTSGDVWELSQKLPAKFAQLRAAGMNLLVSIGGWEGSDVFKTIQTMGVSKFVDQLENDFFKAYNANGINIDLEPGQQGESWSSVYQTYGQLIVDLSNEVASRGYVVSHTPANGLSTSFYVSSCPGLPNDQPILEATYNGSTQSVDYLNVQYYAGGDPQSTPGAESAYNNLVSSLQSISGQTGISDAAAFLMAGFSPEIQDPNYPAGSQPLTGGSPSSQVVIVPVLQALAAKYPGCFGGSFAWIEGYYNPSQPGFSSQLDGWAQMAQASGQ